ncbi:MAG: hypothetical protein ABJI96_01520 [Paracoccaceae bacterium]
MSANATLFGLWGWKISSKLSARTGSKRPTYRGPIFITDAVLPWGNETMLLDRLRKDAFAAMDEQDSEKPGF